MKPANPAAAEMPPDRRSFIVAVAVLLAGVALIASFTDVFFDFAAQLHSGNPAIQTLDRGVHDWCVTHRNAAGNVLFAVITQLGSPVALSLAAAAVAGVSWHRHRRMSAAFIVLAVASTYAIDLVLKAHYMRARPLAAQATAGAHGYSFPSGHALGSAAIIGVFAYLVVRGDSRLSVKALAASGAVLAVALICWSRLYLGVHWLTDVLAGAGLGSTWLIVLISLRETVIFLRRLGPLAAPGPVVRYGRLPGGSRRNLTSLDPACVLMISESEHPTIAPAKSMLFIIDFDGTVAPVDTVDALLERFADPAWRRIEEQWVRGEIDSEHCMAAQIALVRGERPEIEQFLHAVQIDPSFADFVHYVGQFAELAVVSDGLDDPIHHALRRLGVSIPIYANRLAFRSGGLGISFPYRDSACAVGSGVCKCAVARALGGGGGLTTVLVGDGRSDLCLARSADLVFAKGSLRRFCETENIPHVPFERLGDVLTIVRGWNATDYDRFPGEASCQSSPD